MTQDEIKKMKEKILKDGSLTEEKKAELFKLLSTMNSESIPYPKEKHTDNNHQATLRR
jgi:hypothetical protein